ncbi:MAG TPA: ribosome maturation factor RimM [Solirubrobacteraceae bacterium]|nr:ribosome maturation factor RimM [Solirubrobacteraceae bacterium]
MSDPGREEPPAAGEAVRPAGEVAEPVAGETAGPAAEAATPVPPVLRAGTVGRAHGLDGSFHVGGVVESVMALLEVGSELLVGGRPARIVRLAGHAGRPIVRLEGSEHREDAEALRGLELALPRTAAPPLEEDEWWAEDLEGCTVRDGERLVGVVTALLTLPSCDVLEVRRVGAEERAPLLVPLIHDAVREVDPGSRVIEIDLQFLGEE